MQITIGIVGEEVQTWLTGEVEHELRHRRRCSISQFSDTTRSCRVNRHQ
jgi:hypothetical protein